MALRQTSSGTETISATEILPDKTETLLGKKFPSIVEIKRQIPKHCFDGELPLSIYYIFKDFAIIASLYLATLFIWNYFPHSLAVMWTPVYWVLQGILFMSIFVLGHDCGHGSFSRHELVNDIIGTVLHSFVLTPYFSWKLSHRSHHKNTGNIDKDEIFFPVRESRDNGTGFLPGFGLGIGWFVYLTIGYKFRRTHHFSPFEPTFVRHVTGVSLSLAYLAAWLGFVYYVASCVGFMHVGYYYLVPVFVFATSLVIITFLHHIEEDVPWYGDDQWDNVRGQISSVDRDYGWAHGLIHNIGTHQIHHLFPKIPHYHLEEATRHFRQSFPELVHIRNDPIISSFIRMCSKFCQQNVISDDTKVHVYK